jgi:2-polyprenyl-3-methyl-5-hydroxy-6-metoxy-1,4-benzoquinol methylase
VKSYDKIILDHYREVAEQTGLNPNSTMADKRTRQLETELICRFVRTALADLMAHGRRLEDIVIADVGCGNGFTLDVVRRLKLGPKVIGYEFSPDLIALARQRFSDNRVEIRAADVRDHKTLGPEPIDILICQRVLINVLDPHEQVLARDNLTNAMHPGGRMLFIEAFQKNLDLLNEARGEFDLPGIKPAHHNRYLGEAFFDTADLIPWNEPSAHNDENFLSTHYFVSRVIHPVLLRDRPFRHNSHFVTFMSQALQPIVGEFSPLRAKVFIRADVKPGRLAAQRLSLSNSGPSSAAQRQSPQADAGDAGMLLFCKDDDWCAKAISAAKSMLGDRIMVMSGRRGYPFPTVPPGHFSAIVSFLSPWILPQALLDRTSLALNFHPGSCDYPGIGCYNFALYENAAEFGAVCHHMLAKVDSGTVVMERLFPVSPDDTIETLRNRTLGVMLEMFRELIARIAKGEELSVSLRQWTRPPFRRIQLEQLARITSEMSPEEIQRRVRAMNYPNQPGAFVEVGSQRFYAPDYPARLSSDSPNRPFIPLLDEILASPDSTVLDVVRRIDRSRVGIALLVTNERKLIATITEAMAAHSAPIVKPISTSDDELLRIMRTADVQQIPLLDGDGRVADLALLHSFFRNSMGRKSGFLARTEDETVQEQEGA